MATGLSEEKMVQNISYLGFEFIKRRRRTVARRAAEVFGVGSLIFYYSLMGPTFFEKPLYCVSVCVRRLTIARKVLDRLTSGLLHLKDHS